MAPSLQSVKESRSVFRSVEVSMCFVFFLLRNISYVNINITKKSTKILRESPLLKQILANYNQKARQREKMSKNQTLEVNVYQKNENTKLSTQTICFEDDTSLASLLNELHRQKQVTNDFLTTLVEKDKAKASDNDRAKSNYKRKVDDIEIDESQVEGLFRFLT